MSGLKLKVSASIHGVIPSYKCLRSTTSSPTARMPANVLSPPNLTTSRGPVSLPPGPQGRRIPPPSTVGKANLDLGFRLLRQTNTCSHKGLSFFSSSDSDKQGQGDSSLGAKSMASDSAKTEPLLNHDPLDKDVSPTPSSRDKPPASMPNADRDCSNKLLTLPTILTLGRVAAVPLLVSTFFVDSWWGATATTSIFIAAAVTDWLDGYLARKMRLGSTFGAFLDPVADKLMVAATLVLFCTRPIKFTVIGQVPWLMTVPAIAIIGREITMSAVREWAASQGSKLSEAVAVNNLGKWKTATQMTALTILLATRDSSIGQQGLVGTGVALLYISAGLAVWSLVVYTKKISKVLLK